MASNSELNGASAGPAAVKRVALSSTPFGQSSGPSARMTGSASNNNNGSSNHNNGAAGASSGLAAGAAATASSNRTAKTYRFELKLFEPTADSFPEFNFAKLVEIEEKKQKKIKKVVNGGTASGLPFEDNDDDVARIAQEMERKYGNAYAGKNCGKDTMNSTYDKGAGYDESDSFIDNTDAYDESVPVEIETERGGFYINSGPLVFKSLSNFERPEDALRIPKARKRTLSSSSEDSVENAGAASANADQPKNGPSDKKAKLHADKSAAKVKSSQAASDGDGSKKSAVKTTTVKDMLRAKRDSMRHMVMDGSGTTVPGGSSADDDESDSCSDDSSDDDDDEDEDDDDDDDDEEDEEDGENENGTAEGRAPGSEADAAKAPKANGGDATTTGGPSAALTNGSAEVRLPSDLPVELMAKIVRLREAGTMAGGPASLFDTTNTELLYQIDTASRAVGVVARNTIYTYLERYLPCTKQTLHMRAKKCRLQREVDKAHKLVRQLREAVEMVMPQVMSAYEVECKRISDLRAEAARADNREQLAALKAPKRRFVWNETTRALNHQLFAQRRQSFHVIKPRKETMDEFVGKFMSEHVLKVWPEGFMRLEELTREFEKRQASLGATGKNVKAKRPADGTAAKSTTSGVAAKSLNGLAESTAQQRPNAATTQHSTTPSPPIQHHNTPAPSVVGVPELTPPSLAAPRPKSTVPPLLPPPPFSEISSDSDDVEFIGECDPVQLPPRIAPTAASANAAKHVQVNRTKYARISPPAADAGKAPAADAPVEPAAKSTHGDRAPSADGHVENVDVAKIMNALKELQ